MATDAVILALALGALCVTYHATRRHRRSANDIEPPTVPSLVPWLGNAIAFDRNPFELLHTCKRRYGSIFKILIAGKVFVVVSDTNTIHALHKNPSKTFTTHPLQLELIKAISGISDEPQFICEVANDRVIPAMKRGLAPPSLASALGKAFDEELLLQIKTVLDPLPRTTIQLSYLVSRTLYFSTVNTLFGPRFLPDLQTYEDFLVLDSNIPSLSSGLPFLGWHALRARDRLMRKFASYLSLIWNEDRTEDLEGVSSPIREDIAELKSSQCSQQQAAAALACMLYGAITNLQYMTFWLLANLVTDDQAMQRVRHEVDNLDTYETADILDGSRTPLLESAIQETLRWSARSSLFRIVDTDAEIRTNGIATVVRRGQCIMANIRAVHYNPSIYADPETFKIDRYLDQETAPPKPMVWGGGEQVCKGRHLAIFEIRRFAIHILHHYTIKPIETRGKMPGRPGFKKIRIIALLADVEDLSVEVSSRRCLP